MAQNVAMEPGPKSPEESLRCLKARPGFKAELMVAEPLVMSPIAFAWGTDGKFWVVEMGDYPLGVDGKNKFGGKIKFLEKSRPDGPYDKMTVFQDNLGFPTGVTPWGKGVIVTCAPDIFYAEDTDGDGKADKKVVLFTGFREGNQQHRVNGLVWGLDNWLYGANGESGGKVKSIKTGVEVNISGRDFRIKPDEGLIEAVSGVTQFGRSRDDWGNWFGNNNTQPMYHYVLEDRYLKRNPHVFYPDVRVQVSEKPGSAEVFPISKPLPRFNSPDALNHFTSACSAIVYRDDLFGPEFVGNSFVSEPVHNLVHREIMTPKGVTFTSKRAPDEQTSEFLASTDNWFRPTTIQTGPDGALWVADMYRYVIEHPEWIPKDWQKKLDLRAGHDKGRIYRVYPEAQKPRAIPRMDAMKAAELLTSLSSPNGWQRDMAQQLLLRDKSPVLKEKLQTILRKSENPLARLHALCVLRARYELDTNDLQIAGKDKSAAVRRFGIQFNDTQIFLPLLKTEYKLFFGFPLEDPDPQVKMQLAYSLGNVRSHYAGKMLGELLSKNGIDPYISAAIFSSINKDSWPTFFKSLQSAKDLPRSLTPTLMRLTTAFGSDKDKLMFLTNRLSSGDDRPKIEQVVMLADLLDGLDAGKASIKNLLPDDGKQGQQALLKRVREIVGSARAIVADSKAPLGEKVPAMRLLARDPDEWQADAKLLASVLVPQMDEDVQLAAAQAIGKIGDPRTPQFFVQGWKSYSPRVRSQILAMVLTRPAWAGSLLDAVESKKILPTELDTVRRQNLLQYRDPGVRARAEKLLAAASNPDRAKVVAQYVQSLPTKGDITSGKKLFVKHCAACHQLGGVGQQVGPDLASVPDKSTEGLLTAILDPNKAVEARYVNYLATTKAGVSLSGVLFAETTTSITLVVADGKKHELLRRDLEELASTGKSPMPEGFEKDVSLQEMADLLSFLRAGTGVQKQSALPRLLLVVGHVSNVPLNMYQQTILVADTGPYFGTLESCPTMGYSAREWH